MVIALCCTKNWYMYLAISIYAIRQTNNVKKIYCFIEDDDIPYIDNVEFININKIEEYILPTSPNYNTQYSKMSYVRCYFSKILNEDKILYIDVDAIVNGDLSKLWQKDTKYIAGVHEPGEWDKHLNGKGYDDTYINSGVLLMNLKTIREKYLDDKMIKLLNTNKYAYPDQDVINIVFKDKIEPLPVEYNSTETTGFIDNAKIVHYIRQRKGWIKSSPRSEIWYNWFNKYIKEVENMYIVKAIGCFTDNEAGIVRQIGDEWEVSKERYEYLAGGNDKGIVVVELIGIKKIQESKEEVKTEEKPKKRKTTKKK